MSTGTKDREFKFQLLHKKSGEKIAVEGVVTKPAGTEKEYKAAITIGPTVSDVTKYWLEIQEKATVTGETDSNWGRETVWTMDASLTITIGDKDYTISTAGDGGDSTVYKLPVSKEDPLQIKYADIKALVKTVAGIDLPSTFPDGSVITSNVEIYELAIDTDKKLFSLDMSANADFEILPGFAVKGAGFVVQRTDGTKL